jgi:hypothetical protein
MKEQRNQLLRERKFEEANKVLDLLLERFKRDPNEDGR